MPLSLFFFRLGEESAPGLYCANVLHLTPYSEYSFKLIKNEKMIGRDLREEFLGIM
jgi:hypothetical protein